MKKLLIILALFLLVPLFNVKASGDLDRILDYRITVSPRDDGTLDMEYYIKWKVLDSSSEGPLEWVKLGIPTRRVDEIKYISGAPIFNIKYYEDGGSYIRIDFSDSYYKNEIVEMNFSFHQKNFFTIDENNRICYRFNPGWFDEILVDELTVYWEKENVYFENSVDENADYYIWYVSNLNYGYTIDVDATYEQSAFPNIDLTKVYEEEHYRTPVDMGLVLTIIFFGSFFVICIFLSIRAKMTYGDGYYYYRGFSINHYNRFHFFHRPGATDSKKNVPNVVVLPSSKGGSGGGGRSCACACACACAGGGRAGCSRKDFYNPNLSVEKLLNNIEKEQD